MTTGAPLLAAGGAPALTDGGAPAYLAGGDCGCCGCDCPPGLPSSYTLDFDLYDEGGAFLCHATVPLTQTVPCGYGAGPDAWAGGCPYTFGIGLNLSTSPTCSWLIQVGESATPQDPFDLADPRGRYDDLDTGVLGVMKNIVLS